MSQHSGGISDAAAEATAAWDDETRHAFDKRHVELIERKMAAHDDALAVLQKGLADVQKLIDSLRDL